MPYCAELSGHMSDIENMKLAMGYGLPEQYPLGMSGLSSPLTDAIKNIIKAISPDNLSGWTRVFLDGTEMYRNDRTGDFITPRQLWQLHRAGALEGMGDLSCGDDCSCSCKKGMSGLGLTAENQAKLDAVLNDASKSSKDFRNLEASLIAAEATGGKKKRPASGSFAENTNVIVGAAKELLAPYFAFKAQADERKANRPIVERAPDWQTPAIIVGGAAVFGMLFYALAKKGK